MLSTIEEITLIARCVAADDRRAFGRLVDEYQEPLRRFLLNLTCGDTMLAADLSQETFIKAYKAIKSFRGTSRFKTWLYRIACNEYYSHRRAYHPTADIDAVPDDQAESSETLSDRHIDIAEAIKRLNDNERATVLLFYMEDMPLRKIAAITGMPEGTIKSHLSRARTKLAHILKN